MQVHLDIPAISATISCHTHYEYPQREKATTETVLDGKDAIPLISSNFR